MVKIDKVLLNRSYANGERQQFDEQHINCHHESFYASIICLKHNSVHLADLTSTSETIKRIYI